MKLLSLTLLICASSFAMATLNKPPTHKEDALINAAYEGDANKLTTLLNDGVDVNAKCHAQTPVIIYAIKNGNKEVVKLLIQRGADTKLADASGKTALEYAKENGHQEIVDLLNKN